MALFSAEDMARIRGHFPALQRATATEAKGWRVFVDTASIGLVPRVSEAALGRFVRQAVDADVRSSGEQHVQLELLRQPAYTQAARLLGLASSDEDRLALIESTAQGLNLAAQAIAPTADDNVLIADCEYAALPAAWRFVKGGAPTVRVVPCRRAEGGAVLAEDFARAVDGKTRAICVSSVQWCTGYRVDVEAFGALCRRHGIWLVVDAIQELGAMGVAGHAHPADFLVAGGHKWLMSPFGSGLMLVSRRALAELTPPIHGYLTCEPAGGWPAFFQAPNRSPFEEMQPSATARRFEVGGTPSRLAGVGLAAGLGFLNEQPAGAIESHIRTLTDLLHDELDALGLPVVSHRGRAERSGITVFGADGGHSPAHALALAEALVKQGILVSVRYSSGVGGVRVATHLYNTPEDIYALARGVAAAVRR